MHDPDYQGFWDALPGAAMLAGREGVTEAFRQQYREEIFGLLSWLHRVGLFGGATHLHPEPPSECDHCAVALADCQWFVDGRAPHGGWASMCAKFFLIDGHSIGWGKGQLYLNVSDGNWRLVAGGDQSFREAESDGGE